MATSHSARGTVRKPYGESVTGPAETTAVVAITILVRWVLYMNNHYRYLYYNERGRAKGYFLIKSRRRA